MGVENIPAYGTGYTLFEGSWAYYNGNQAVSGANSALSSVGNMQLHWGSSESVKLSPKVEFETFFTTDQTGSNTSVEDQMKYFMTVFGRENAFTHRNFKDEDYWPYVEDEYPKQCHNFLPKWRTTTYPIMPVNSSQQANEPVPDGMDGFSNVFGIKIREMFFPDTIVDWLTES